MSGSYPLLSQANPNLAPNLGPGGTTPKYFLVLRQLDSHDMAQAATVWSVFFYVWAITLVTPNPTQTLTSQPLVKGQSIFWPWWP